MSSASEVVAVFSPWRQASVAHADHRSAHVQKVPHLQVGIVPLLTGCERHSNPVACCAAEFKQLQAVAVRSSTVA